MLIYSRFVPADAGELALIDTVDHVRAHLSSVAELDDNPETRADDVRVAYKYADGGTLVTGYLDADADAPYLRDDFDPSADGDYVFRRWVPTTEETE